MHHPTDRIAHTTAFVIPVVAHWLEQERAQWFNDTPDTKIKCYLHKKVKMKYVYIYIKNSHGYKHSVKETHRMCMCVPADRTTCAGDS